MLPIRNFPAARCAEASELAAAMRIQLEPARSQHRRNQNRNRTLSSSGTASPSMGESNGTVWESSARTVGSRAVEKWKKSPS